MKDNDVDATFRDKLLLHIGPSEVVLGERAPSPERRFPLIV